jgi:hypothetical protein
MTGLTGPPGGGPGPQDIRCSDASRLAREPLGGSAPRADVWVAVEHVPGWGDATLTRSGHGVRVLMARGPRMTSQPGSASEAGGVPSARVDDARGGASATGVRVWIGHCTATPTLRVGWVESAEVVADWDLADIAAGSLRDWGQADPDPLLLVCANGRRDRCCGHSGGRLADVLWRGPHADRVLTCTHLGGHRFAPTALLLPVGALHGRLDPVSATALLSDAVHSEMGAVTLRGHSTRDEPAQVAEAHTRVVTGHRGLAPLPVGLAASDDPDRMHARVRGWDPRDAQRPLEVELVRSRSTTLQSCGREPEPTTRWTVSP